MQRRINHQVGQAYYVQHHGEGFGSCFFDDACFRFYLPRLINSLKPFHVQLHAYCLLPDRVCLLLTPGTPCGVINLLQAIGQQYNEYYEQRFNRRQPVLGYQIESIKADSDSTALLLQRLVERLPLEQELVDHPGAYRWSSYCENAFGKTASTLLAHRGYSIFTEQAANPFARYREFIASPAGEITEFAA